MSKKIRNASYFFFGVFLVVTLLTPMKVEAGNIFETNTCDDTLLQIKEQKVSLSSVQNQKDNSAKLYISKMMTFDRDSLLDILDLEQSSIDGKMYARDAINDILSQKEEEFLRSQSILNNSNIVDVSKEEMERMYLDATSFEETNDTVYCTVTKLFVREFPQIDSTQVSYLSYNEPVKRLGMYDNGWSKILLGEDECYVSTSYISTEKQQIKGNISLEKVDAPITYRGDINLTDEEYDTLLLLAMSEAGNTSYDCTLACVETVLNRMAAGFGTFDEVIKAYYINYKKVPNQQCIDAVNQALTSNTFPSNMYYFRTKHYHKFGTPYMNIDNVYFSLGDE